MNRSNLNEELKKYCPTDTPITIPYMEVYRTDELSYTSYVSPLNSMGENTSTTTSSDQTDTDDTPKVVEKKRVTSQKEKNQKLYTQLSNFIQQCFKEGVNVNTLVNRYRLAGLNISKIQSVTDKSIVWLKPSFDSVKVSDEIYKIIDKYG